jgi:CMP-2-keto-3-deoxyoctulosonic acid synthetase
VLEKSESVEMLRLLEQNYDLFAFITSINGPAVDTESDLSVANALLDDNK